MEKIGSEFLDDFGNEERPFLFGMTKRHFILAVAMVLAMAVTITVVFLELSDVIWIVFNLLCIPFYIYGIGMDERLKLKEKFYFLMLETVRVYQTEFDRKE